MIRHNPGFYLANRNTEQQVIRKGTTYTAPIIQKSQRTMAIIEIGNNQNRLPGNHLSPFIHTTVQVPGTVLVIPHNFLNEINMTRENRP